MGYPRTLKKQLKSQQSKGWPFILSHIFSPQSWCLVSGLCLCVFSVPGVYIETYLYDDMYIRIFITKTILLLVIDSGNHIYSPQVKNNSFPPINSLKIIKNQHSIIFISERYYLKRANKKLSNTIVSGRLYIIQNGLVFHNHLELSVVSISFI